MSDLQFQSDDPQQSMRDRNAHRRGKRSSWRWFWYVEAVIAVLIVLAAGYYYFIRENVPPDRRQPDPDAEAVVAQPSQPESAAEESGPPPREIAVQDDGQLLWISPTAGPPIDLSYVPAGTQLLVHLRLGELAEHREGEKVFAALGPWGQLAAAEIQQQTGVSWHEIDQLLLAVTPRQDGSLGYTLRATFTEPWTEQQLAERFPESRVTTQGDKSFRIRNDATVGPRTCFLPQELSGSTLVVCPADEAIELMESGGVAPPFPREMDRLLQQTDADRIVTIVFPLKFLQASGHDLLTGLAKPLRTSLEELLGEQATAVALSADWRDEFFLELRSTVALNRPPHRYADELLQQIDRLSNACEDTLLSASLHPYSRKVLGRYPAMLRSLGNYTRASTDQRQAILRCYLPITAGHNLLAGSELLLSRPTGTATASATPVKQLPQTLDEKLQRTTSLSFPKESLQQALQILSEDIGVPITILGRDLQLEGITKNQSLRLDLHDRLAGEILLEVLLRANPDRTARGADDLKQKLVYSIREASDAKPAEIVITTRAAAARRGERLPEVFGDALR